MLQLVSDRRTLLRKPRRSRIAFAAIPHMPARRTTVAKALATYLDPRGAAARAFAHLSSALLQLPEAPRTILLASDHRSEGKSVCASNLAIALAQAGRSVVLVDANLRHPVQHVHFELEPAGGLVEVLECRASLRFLLRSSEVERLSVLTAGSGDGARPALDERELCAVLNELRVHFDHVIIDGPTLRDDGDADELARACDMVLLVERRRAEFTVHRAA